MEGKGMDRMMLIFVGGVVLVAFVFFAFANATLFSQNSNPSPTGLVPSPGIAPPSGSVQVVSLSVQGANYVATPNTVRQNQPVRFVADMQSLSGCSRALVIPQLNVRKVFSQNDNTVEFTPTKTGALQFSCSMGMYKGLLNVVS